MKKKLVVLQDECSDCGICCLLSIFHYYDYDISKEKLRYQTNTTKYGVNAYDLVKCAKDNLFESFGKKCNKLEKVNLPYIAHVRIKDNLYHFVVVYEINNKYVKVMDPAYGFKKYSFDEFYKIYNGIIIFIYPLTNFKFNNKSKKINIINLSLYTPQIILNCLLDLIIIFLSICLSYFMPYFYNNKNIYVLYMFIFLIFVKYSFDCLYVMFNKKLINKIKSDVHLNFLKHIFRLPLNYIHIKESGEIIKRVEDVENVCNIKLNNYITYVSSIFIILIIFSILLINVPFLSLFLIINYILYLFLSYYYYKKNNIHLNSYINSTTQYKSKLINIIDSLISIKHRNSGEYYLNSINDDYKDYLDNDYKYFKKNNIISLSQNILINLINLLLISYIIFNNIDLVYSVTYFSIISILNDCILNISSTFPSIFYIKNINEKVIDFYNFIIPSDTFSSFSNGCISLSKNNYFLNNKLSINFSNILINKNDKVIIKGKNGSGKSTLCKILIKELYVNKNIVKINNMDINNIDENDLRNHIILSNQNEKIINGTIKDNILMGINIDNDILNKYLTSTEFDKILAKHNFGMETYLFGDDCALSGGEKQILFLIRALVASPDILILDETLSEVNEILESKILNYLYEYFKNTTIIYVTHKNTKNNFKKTIYV